MNVEKVNLSFIEKHNIYFLPIFLLLADYIAILTAEQFSFIARDWLLPDRAGTFHLSWLSFYVFVPLIYITFLQLGQLYFSRREFWQVVEKLFYTVLYAILAIVLLLYVVKIADNTSRLYVGLLWISSFIFLTVFRYGMQHLFMYLGILQLPVLLIGAGKTGALVAKSFSKDPGLGYKIIGFLEDDVPQDGLAANFPVLGRFADAEHIIRTTQIKYVVITAPGLSKEALLALLYRIQPLVKNVSFVPDLLGMPTGGITLENLFNEKLVLLQVKNNLARKYNRIFKFCFDLVLTTVGSICILPVLLVIALLIYKDDPGPVIFKHMRIGRNGRLFPCYKFRSMCIDAPERLQKYLAENPAARREWQREFKLKDDPRVTKIGAFLRRTSLDELPQIFNVFRGEMSLVGPRPIIEAEIVKYGQHIQDFYAVRPGITGFWQVNGRSDTTYDERVEMDSWYVRNWSVWLDLMILFRTFKAVFSGKGAY